MSFVDDPNLPALERGIMTVGVGRNGSADCSSEVVDAIIAQLKSGSYDRAQWGAFLGALWMKGASENELRIEQALGTTLLSDPLTCLQAQEADFPDAIAGSALRLMEGGDLDYRSSYELGRYFLQRDIPPFIAAFFASALRVKYETMEEFSGLLHSFQDALPHFKRPAGTLIQFTEPHDGALRSHTITPQLQRFFGAEGFATLALTSDSAGPKYGPNLKAVAQGLNASFVSQTGVLQGDGRWGHYLDQDEYIRTAPFWRNVRRSMRKRPFLATLEKLLNPLGADILVTSAFHAPYAQKMVDLAKTNGFRGVISTFKSVEGGLCLSLGRAATLVVARRRGDQWQQQTMKISPEDFGIEAAADCKDLEPTVQSSCELLNSYTPGGSSHFERSIDYSTRAYRRAVAWIEEA